MSLTIKKVPTVLSIHQMDEVDDPKCNLVRRVCREGKKLPTLVYAPETAHDSRLMKKVRSFGSFDDLRVPDIDGYSNEETGSYNSDSDSFSGGGYVQDVSPFDRIQAPSETILRAKYFTVTTAPVTANSPLGVPRPSRPSAKSSSSIPLEEETARVSVPVFETSK